MVSLFANFIICGNKIKRISKTACIAFAGKQSCAEVTKDGHAIGDESLNTIRTIINLIYCQSRDMVSLFVNFIICGNKTRRISKNVMCEWFFDNNGLLIFAYNRMSFWVLNPGQMRIRWESDEQIYVKLCVADFTQILCCIKFMLNIKMIIWPGLR